MPYNRSRLDKRALFAFANEVAALAKGRVPTRSHEKFVTETESYMFSLLSRSRQRSVTDFRYWELGRILTDGYHFAKHQTPQIIDHWHREEVGSLVLLREDGRLLGADFRISRGQRLLPRQPMIDIDTFTLTDIREADSRVLTMLDHRRHEVFRDRPRLPQGYRQYEELEYSIREPRVEEKGASVRNALQDLKRRATQMGR